MEAGGFGANAGIALDQPSAGKTGTTQDSKSVWFIGYTPQPRHRGDDRRRQRARPARSRWSARPIGGSYIYEASGSGFAGPMWGDAMHVIEQWLPYDDFVGAVRPRRSPAC